jgi:YbgC/YbaW family acyl-CoA thioester hydrolase
MRSSRTSVPTFEIRLRVHRTDVDPGGVIDLGAYARFIEIAETEFFRWLGFTHVEFESFGIALPRVHVEFEFYKPAGLDDELSIAIGARAVGVHSIRLKVAVTRSGEEAKIAEATIVSSCVDATTHRSVALPDAFAEALRSQLVDS